jgi:hypothetical protein
MTRAWLEVGGEAAYHRLCSAVLALARAGVARLVARDGDPLAGDAPPPTQFASRIAELQAAWMAAEAQVPGGGPLGRLARLLRMSDSFVETVLFALFAAPGLDRGLARAYAALELPGARSAGAASGGLVLELASTHEAHRFALAAALHPDASLRRSGLVLADGGDHDAAVASTTFLRVAASALAVLRCEPVPLPANARELWSVPVAGVAAAVLADLGVPLVERGRVTALLAGEVDRAAALASARLLAAADGRGVWVVSLADGGEPAWPALVRDAALANALAVVVAPAAGAWIARAAHACERAMTSIVCVTPGNADAGAVDVAALAARAPRVARTGDRSADELLGAVGARPGA